MEQRESHKSIIHRNFYDLITLTKFSTNFLEKFLRQGVFNDDDTQVVPWFLTDKAPAMERACQIYMLIMNGDKKLYEILLESLRETGQFEVCNILTGEDDSNPSRKSGSAEESRVMDLDYIPIEKVSGIANCLQNSSNFKSPPLDVIRLLANDSKKILVLCSQNVEATAKWIQETVKNVKVLQSNSSSESFEIDGDTVGLFMQNDSKFRSLSKFLNRLPRNKGKFVVLYSDKRAPTFLDEAVLTGNDDLQMDNLTEAFKVQLVKRLSDFCCSNNDLIDPKSKVFMSPSTVIRLVALDEDKWEKGLLVSLVENYLDEAAPDVNFENKLLMKMLARIAVRQQFPSWEEKVFGDMSPSPDHRLERFCKCLVTTGILRSSSKSELKFTDSCFTSYFLGKYIGEEGVNVAAFIEVLLETHGLLPPAFKNEMCMYFLDHFIGSQCLSGLFTEKTSIACVRGNHVNILSSITSGGKLSSVRVLTKAVCEGRIATIEWALNAFMKTGGKLHGVIDGGDSLFHSAVRRGDFQIVSKLWNEYGFHREIKKKYMMDIVRLCVQSTLKESVQLIIQRKQILELLLKADKSLLTESDSNTPLLQERVHLDLIKLLVSYGANLDATDKNGRTIAHIGYSISPEQYHELISYLVESGRGQLLTLKGPDGINILMTRLLSCKDGVPEKTIKLFLRAGLDLNERNSKGDSVIRLASRKGGEQLLKFLVNAGANWKQDEKQILFHAIASTNIEALEYFVSLGADVNVTFDFEKTSSLHVALLNVFDIGGNRQHEMVKCLLKLGASVNSKDVRGKTPINYLESKGKPFFPELYKLMKEKATTID